MSESARKKRRVSPSSSDRDDPTLRSDLRHLSNLIPKPATPFRRAATVDSTPGSNRRTPNNIPIRTRGTAARTPRGATSIRAGGPGRRAAPTTPHAIRALRERANAARTPGRRRSGRAQRETPRDILRALSRTLAKDTVPTQPSPAPSARRPRKSVLDLADVLDDEPDPIRPRLSMPLDDLYEDDDDDDSIHGPPPRPSLLPDLPDDVDEGTLQSLEFGRRAYSEDPRGLFTARLSERFGELNELGLVDGGEEFEVDGAFVNRRRTTFDPDRLLEQVIGEGLEGEGEEEEGEDVTRLGGSGAADEMDEPTFRFTIPATMRRVEREEALHADGDVAGEEGQGPYYDEDDDDEEGADINIVVPNDHEPPNEPPPSPPWDSDLDAEGEDDSLRAYREEPSAIDRSLQTHSHSPTPHPPTTTPKKARARTAKTIHISRSGHEYPSFPAAVVKRIATGMVARSAGSTGRGKPKISNDTLAALVQTTDWFFEQVGEDLSAYARHAGRKVVEEADVVCLMERQRQISAHRTAFSLAQKMLPRELLRELRMQPVSGKGGRQKRKRMEVIREEEEEDEDG